MQNQKLKEFVDHYFAAESRANNDGQGGKQFLVKDKVSLVIET
ncbi:MAG: hypothetical protein ACRC6V_01780 [Bacteroidales bacterium]